MFLRALTQPGSLFRCAPRSQALPGNALYSRLRLVSWRPPASRPILETISAPLCFCFLLFLPSASGYTLIHFFTTSGAPVMTIPTRRQFLGSAAGAGAVLALTPGAATPIE